MTLSIRNRARLRTAIGVGAVGIVVAIAYDVTVSAALDYHYTLVYFLSSVYLGATIGFGLAAFELFYVEGHHGAWLRRAPLGVSLAVTVTSYTVILAALQVSVWLVFGDYPYLSRGEFAFGRVGFREVLTYFSLETLRDYTVAMIVFVFIYLFVRMRRIIGGRVLTNILLGRYDPPAYEDNVFMFLDLADSTRLAEELGDLKFQALVSRFFFDIDEAILDHAGEPHRYVGDEVVVVWPLDDGVKDAMYIRCFFAIVDIIEENAKSYAQLFGVVPSFRAGFHGGTVVAAKCGDSRQEISYFGDTVNTAARVQELCKQTGHTVVVSGDLMSRIDLPPELKKMSLGRFAMRGKQKEMEVFSVGRQDR